MRAMRLEEIDGVDGLIGGRGWHARDMCIEWNTWYLKGAEVLRTYGTYYNACHEKLHLQALRKYSI